MQGPLKKQSERHDPQCLPPCVAPLAGPAYTLRSVFVMSIALITLAVLYEQLAKDLLNRLTGERLDA